MAAASGGHGGSVEEDAKHVLDKFGQQVYDEIVEKEAKIYKQALTGQLSLAKVSGGEGAHTTDPCQLENEYTKLISGSGGSLASGVAARGHPCGNVSGNGGTGNDDLKRFSKESGGECDKNKISGNKDDEGACAPYRRLSLCNKNFQKINNIDSSKARHNLLVDVCMAAKFEGESIKHYSEKYDEQYPSSGSSFTTCTMLARSFADIGDIVRGRDLYFGKRKKKIKTETERDKLEENFKKYFQQIHEDVTKGRSASPLQARYQGDADNNFYQLREDWWTANRATVWEAITCDVKGNRYFRATCSDSHRSETFSQAKDNCRCKDENGNNTDQVPTYFDYVPQYLRWFEEWGEDFCRKKKKYVNIVKKFCRNDEQNLYCSLNGHDCTQTIRKIGLLRMGNGCTKCLHACSHYRGWLANQEKEFKKQKTKYEKEINGSNPPNKGTSNTLNNEYDRKFYEELNKSEYGTVDAFLEKLSKEKTCTAITTVEGTIDFTKNGPTETFYRSDYCQPCPHCGVRKTNDGKWEPKGEGDKCNIKLYKPKPQAKGTPINFLYSGDETNEIAEKLKKFCQAQNGTGGVANGNGDSGTSGSKELYQYWTCYEIDELTTDGQKGDDDHYYEEDVRTGGGLCILKNDKNKKEEKEKMSEPEPAEFQKTFNPFFNFWVAHMLKDSIYWETQELKKCLKNEKKKCGNQQCKKPCDCFQNWITQKKTEWDPIKTHFKKQKNLLLFTPDALLKQVLELEFENKNTEEDKKNNLSAREIHLINEMLKEDEKEQEASVGGVVNEENTPIDKLIRHEKGIANKCKKCEDPPQQVDRGVARNLDPTPPRPAGSDAVNPDDQDEDSDEDNDVISLPAIPPFDEEEPEETAEDPEQVEEVTEKSVEVCSIVETLFTSDDKSLKEACGLKYGPKAPTSWKCVTPSGDNNTRGEPTGKSDGSICVPPRRRKLYIGKIKEWADKVANTQVDGSNKVEGSDSANGDKQAPSEASQGTTPASPSNSRDDDALRDAFIQSAAIETFFLWHRYKKEWTLQKKAERERNGEVVANTSEVGKELQKKLEEGEIPEEFKRQMFYTLGDYRDICVGAKEDVIKALEASSDTKIKDISDKIEKILKESASKAGDPPGPPNSVQQRKDWWDDNAKHIWKGMVCALTYDTDSEQKSDGAKPKHLEDVEEAFFGDNNNRNPPLPGTTGNTEGTYEKTYKYETVSFGASGTDAKGNDDTLNNPKLSDFVEIPTFFRYLHEWGENFCTNRTEMLEKIKEECRSGTGGHEYCSGDGHDCTEKGDLKHKDMSADPDCPSCYEQCRKYKKWIDMKFQEFHEQKKKYEKEHKKLKANSNGDYKKLKDYTSAADFLAALKHCKNNQGNSDQDNKLDFEDIPQTFSRSTYCKTCPIYGVKCNSGGRNATNGCTEKDPNWEKVFDTINGNNEKITENINLEMIDRRGPFIEEYMNEKSQNSNDLFNASRLFKGIREQKWTCKFKDKNTDVCKLDKFHQEVDLNQYTTFKVLLEHWLQDFLEGYYILKKRIEICTKDENSVIQGSTNKCECVRKWIEKKEKEWEQIKHHYNKKDYGKEYPIAYKVISYFEKILSDVNEYIDNFDSLKNEKEYENCYVPNNCITENNKREKDIVSILLSELKKKIDTSNTQLDERDENCDALPLNDPGNPDDDTPDEPLDDDTSTTSVVPEICKDIVTPEPAPPSLPEQEKEDEKDKGDEKEEKRPQPPPPPPPAPTKPQRPRKPPTPQLLDHPAVIPALVTSTLAWSVGIGFATFTYFYLKKKTKSTIDLLRVINIPKSDYDIPTKLSPNRYIPYTSGKYRGKRYIYLEGDSGTDSGYTDHYSDITSSSESEYEEMDINDIYVPGSPKYKTLIEVVLEPSGNNTTASGNNTTASDTQNDIPTSDTPPPITDDEWNTLKHDFISNMLQNEPNDIPNDYKSGNSSTNTNITTTSRHNVEEKPFITSIHDRNLYTGDEISYNIDMSTNSMDDRQYVSNNVYSGIDLINDALNGDYDIYNEMLKRKENELFGTNHVKQTSIHSVAKLTNSDPIHNQLELFHKWLDRHRDMCEQWNNKEELLDKLKEEWENETHSGNTHPSDSNKTLNTDVSIQIHMDDPKPINQFTNMDTILDDLDKYNEPYYDVQDDIYYDVNDDHDTSTVDTNAMDVPSKVQIEMDVNTKLVKEKYPIADVWDI
ncbi:erythrocyte membrane protein 1 [Plasmodium falciparum IGH-CR14]|uniref:Erythrocyte membrane protein 1 n=1 Tax=Plasmodium falciparum IGH-CR14 TaxID=580059 RepID=A0A0L1I4Z9_PLAFA|nr:erythrocyte membrane protein 1 [Plasmodium falciparum IGH-CR14]